MNTVFYLTIKSLKNRMFTTSVTILSIAVSVCLLLAVERLRVGAKDGFRQTISQTDLIVGAKGGTLQLLLYSVFRLGAATENIEYETFEKISNWAEVKWAIPYSLGDSYRGYRVVGTDENFYKFYQYRRDKHIEFVKGHYPKDVFDVVCGSSVCDKLNLNVGQNVVLSHGIGDVSFQNHKDKPFKLVGMLAHTGSPIDRSLYITLEGMEAIHIDWSDGAPPLKGISADSIRKKDIKVGQITSFLLATKSRLDVLQLQRNINDYEEEPLIAIMPGVVLGDLWDGMAFMENGLLFTSVCVVFVGLLGMMVSIFYSLMLRRREMSILRSIGASAFHVFSLLIGEAFVLSILGCVLGVFFLETGLFILEPLLLDAFGVSITGFFGWNEFYYLCIIIGLAMIMGVIPAVSAYRSSLDDGLQK